MRRGRGSPGKPPARAAVDNLVCVRFCTGLLRVPAPPRPTLGPGGLPRRTPPPSPLSSGLEVSSHGRRQQRLESAGRRSLAGRPGEAVSVLLLPCVPPVGCPHLTLSTFRPRHFAALCSLLRAHEGYTGSLGFQSPGLPHLCGSLSPAHTSGNSLCTAAPPVPPGLCIIFLRELSPDLSFLIFQMGTRQPTCQLIVKRQGS